MPDWRKHLDVILSREALDPARLIERVGSRGANHLFTRRHTCSGAEIACFVQEQESAARHL